MKKRDYLSPSAIKIFYEDIEKFYKMYLCDVSTPREPQTPPMAIGSAFDAHVKSYLHSAIYGKGYDPAFELQTLFEAQVEAHIRDTIRPHGEYAFKVYEQSGALKDLLAELMQASKAPQFEVEISGIVQNTVTNQATNMVLLGKPDVYYTNKDGNSVILDWKVNGWFAKQAKSPAKGYLRLRNSLGNSGDSHKDCVPILHNGMVINGNLGLEDVDEDWAIQVAIYGWILGEPIGGDFISCIDQLVCKPTAGYPEVRIAEHRCKIGPEFQAVTFCKAMHVWDICQNGHVFRNLSPEDSAQKCAVLDEVQRMVLAPKSEDAEDFASFTKKSFY